MGFLSEASDADGGSDLDTGAEDTSTEATAQEPSAGAAESQAEAVAEAPQKGERVALPSRRERAAQRQNDIAKKLEDIQKTFGDTTKQWEQRMATLAEENARLRGGFEAIQQQRQAPVVQQAPQKSVDEIRREARKALDSNDFDTWERLNTEAILAQVRPLIPQQQAYQQAPGPSPIVQAMLMQHPAVVNAGDRGIQLAIAEDNRLAALGHQSGPERFQAAFELASKALGGQPKASYSQQSRGALAGVPRERSSSANSGGGEPGVVLTQYEMQVAEKCGMTKAEYAKYIAEMDPKRVTG